MSSIVFTSYVFISIVIFNHFFSRSDVIAGAWYLLAFIYSVFGYAAYVYDFEIYKYYDIELLSADDIYLGLYLHIVTLISFFTYVAIGRRYIKKHSRPIKIKINSNFIHLTYFLIVNLLVIYFILNLDGFMWGEGNRGASGLFWYTFRLLELITVMISVTKLMQLNSIRLMVIFSLIFILIVNIKAGNRSDLLYILIAYFICAFHCRVIIGVKWFAKNLPILLLVFVLLQIIYIMREVQFDTSMIEVYEGFYKLATETDLELLKTKFYMQDYFAPSATLVMAIDNKIIDPYGWMVSNFFNLIPGFEYPTVSDLILKTQGREFERGAGFSYNIFADGYILAGMWGSIFIGILSGFIPAAFSILSNSTKGDIRALILVGFGFLMLQFLRNSIGTSFRLFIMLFIPSFIYVSIWLNKLFERD